MLSNISRFSGHHQFLARLCLYAVFTALCLLHFRWAQGDDLSSSYLACRLIASGNWGSIYDYNPLYFHIVDSAEWVAIAKSSGFTGFMHPYVQTPLWAWAIQPICVHSSFNTFKLIFMGLALCCLMVMIEIVARMWARRFQSPFWLAALLTILVFTTPFRYSMALTQTHAIFLVLAVGAIAASEHGRDASAGFLLALSAAVKITPGLFLIYWLMKRRFGAAAWFLSISAILVALTIAISGTSVFSTYVATLKRISNVLLVSFNNQSFASWWAYSPSEPAELLDWRILKLPPVLKHVSTVGAVWSVAFAAWLARGRNQNSSGISLAIGLIGMTVFAPIAWTHYYIVLIPAVMILCDSRNPYLIAMAAIVALLNIPPIAVNPVAPHITDIAIVRSQLFSGLIAMLALSMQALKRYTDSALPFRAKTSKT